MPSFTHHGASIYYEEYGQGFPILTFAPAGLMSVIDVWNRPSAPINPIKEFGLFAIIWAESKFLHNQLISVFSDCIHCATQRPGVESA